MNNLYAFGCSNTRGDALDDIWDYDKKDTIPQDDDYYPSKYAWPQLLADKLNLNCFNYGISGASNKQIWYELVNAHIKKNDTVIVQWTFIDRYYVIDYNRLSTNNQIGPWRSDIGVLDDNGKRQRDRNNAFYKHFHTNEDVLYDLNLRISHADLYAKQQGFKIFHATCDNNGVQLLPFNHAKILKTSIQYIQNETQSCANDRDKTGGHPGILAHKVYADRLYNEILSL